MRLLGRVTLLGKLDRKSHREWSGWAVVMFFERFHGGGMVH
jgi:hypothetical protein